MKIQSILKARIEIVFPCDVTSPENVAQTAAKVLEIEKLVKQLGGQTTAIHSKFGQAKLPQIQEPVKVENLKDDSSEPVFVKEPDLTTQEKSTILNAG